MTDADINDINIELEPHDETTSIPKPNESSSNSDTTSIYQRKYSNTAMDIYSEFKSKREDELLEIIEGERSKNAVLEQKIHTLEHALKETLDKEQERGQKKRKLAESNDDVNNENGNLRNQIENLTKRLCERENELHDVREKLAESEWKESNDIERLKKEIEQLKMKEIKDNKSTQMKALQKVIDNKDKEIQNLQRTNERLNLKQNETEADQTNANDNINTTSQLMNMIEEKMAAGFNLIQTNVEKLIKDRLVEPDIEMESNLQANHTTYADMVSTHKKTASDFREIMLATKNEEIMEEHQKKRRAKNLIVHGMSNNSTENDKEFINEMLKDLQIGQINIKHIERIGNNNNNTIGERGRPLKIEFNNEEDQRKVFSNLRNLKGKNIYIGISVREDYTYSERALIKNFIEQAKAKNLEENAKNSDIVWRVRGTPKNGLSLKWFTKDQNVTSTN